MGYDVHPVAIGADYEASVERKRKKDSINNDYLQNDRRRKTERRRNFLTIHFSDRRSGIERRTAKAQRSALADCFFSGIGFVRDT
jgi:hypothetical protein